MPGFFIVGIKRLGYTTSYPERHFLWIGSPPKNLPNKNGKDIAPGLFMDKFSDEE